MQKIRVVNDMPSWPKHPCAYQGCPVLIDDSSVSDKTADATEGENPKDAIPEKLGNVYPSTDVLFSRKAVEDSFIAKVNETVPEKAGVRITDLDKRLSLLSH